MVRGILEQRVAFIFVSGPNAAWPKLILWPGLAIARSLTCAIRWARRSGAFAADLNGHRIRAGQDLDHLK
jgi:hypothetical protein